MQREILFRALRKDGQGWVEGFYLHYSSRHEILVPHSQEVLDYDLYPVHPETVGQYTGLTDKNGVRIFEGDVTRLETHEYYKKETFKVVYDMGAFTLAPKEGCVTIHKYIWDAFKAGVIEDFSNVGTLIEVIGNIYEGGNNG